jgi:glutathione S-transferase
MALKLVIGNKNYSSWSLRPWLALKWTGEPFDEVRIPLDTPETAAAIRQWSAAGRVPVLVVDGKLTIWDSIAICEYLAERFPEARLWPKDPETRAVARSVSAEMHSGFALMRKHLSMDCRTRYPEREWPEAVAADLARVQQIWRDCRTQYGRGGDFLFGHRTIADAMYAPVVSRFLTYAVPMDDICRAYSEAILALPAMVEWFAAAEAETEVLINH